MSLFFNNTIKKYCSRLLDLINNEKPAELVNLLLKLNILYEDNSILLYFYTFGYCLGSLDYVLRKKYNSNEFVDLVMYQLNTLFKKNVAHKLTQKGLSRKQKAKLINDLMPEIQYKRSFVQYLLESKEEDFSDIITTSYLDDIGISQFNIEADDDLHAIRKSIVDMITFTNNELSFDIFK